VPEILMPKLAPTLLMLAAVAGPLAMPVGAGEAIGQGTAPSDTFGIPDHVRAMLAQGVQEYRSGRPDAAAATFAAVLKHDPDSKLLYEFYLSAGYALLMSMEEKDQLRDVVKKVREGAFAYMRKLRRTEAYIAILMGKLEKSEEERLVATNELVAVGPIAVPHLIARLGDNRQDIMRVYCRVVLTKMHYRAVVPLCEALNAKDQRLVESISGILADIGDPRALPKLKQLGESKDTSDTAKRAVANTVAAIHRKAGAGEAWKRAEAPKPDPKAEKIAKDAKKDAKDPVAPAPAAAVSDFQSLGADKLYFLEAMRYFRGGDRVQDEMVANESLMWRWNEEEQDAAKKLAYVRTPRYAWNELMAEELLADGMASYPAFTAYQPLWSAALAAQDVEAKHRERIAKERTSPVQHPDEAIEAIQERIKALTDINLHVRLTGADNLYRAVQQSIVSERYDVAVYLMQLLQDRYIADADRLLPSKEEGLTSDKAGTVLVAALDHGDKRVRYQAAITLAHLDPHGRFFNAERVPTLLADAVGEWGMRVIAVVDQDYRHRNAARQGLQSHGYLPRVLVDGFDLMQALEETPMKDAILIAGDLLPNLRDEYGKQADVPEQKLDTLIAALRKDWRSEKTPILIALPENPELAGKIQAAFEGKVDGFVRKPFDGTELEGKIEAALKAKGEPPNVNRDHAEAISQAAAKALMVVDPTRTQFELAKIADALVGTADKRADDVRVPALRALGLVAQHPQAGAVKALVTKLTDVYGAQDAELEKSPEARKAFLYAIGQLDPTTDAAIAILLKALKHADAGVRKEAADAVARAAATKPEVLIKYHQQQRLDARAPGKGAEPQ